MIILKYLRVFLKQYSQMARSIESLLDLSTMSIEELTGRLKVCDEHDDEDEEEDAGGGKLLLTEEQWRARMNQGAPFGGGGGNSSGKQNRNKGRGRDGARDNGHAGTGTGGGPTRDDECRYCGKRGHWARDCHKKKRRRRISSRTTPAAPMTSRARSTSRSCAVSLSSLSRPVSTCFSTRNVPGCGLATRASRSTRHGTWTRARLTT
ncbi:hypothetical protein MPTK2_6g90090P [Marchantia polymorpha subsp. ruderalis]